MADYEHAIIVRTATELEQLKQRYNTEGQAKFMLAAAAANVQVQEGFLQESSRKILGISANAAKARKTPGSGDFTDYNRQNTQYYEVLERVEKTLSRYLKVKVVDRSFLPNYLFGEKDLVVVIGQDGLVANTAKYARGLPMIAINPDPDRFDGILLPFKVGNYEAGLRNLLEERASIKEVTMAEAVFNDGQRLLAFNDFFIGASSHVSARYKLVYQGQVQQQSSSGILVSTGVGSTGWLSSVFNMANGLSKTFTGVVAMQKQQLAWDEQRLLFVVREPFQSRTSEASLAAGTIAAGEELVVESLMARNGVVFSDGIESDHLKFEAGTVVRLGIAPERAKIVLPV